MENKKILTLIYVQKDNKTLFLKRAQKTPDEISTGKYLGVGGKVDKEDSSIENAAKREMLEETNLQAKSLIKKGIVTFIGQKDYPLETHIFICKDFTGALKGDDREGTLHWIDNEKIDTIPLWEGDKEFLPKLFEEGVFNLILRYEGKKLVSVE